MLHPCPQYPPKTHKPQPQKKQVPTVVFSVMDILVQLQGHRTALLELLAKPLGKRSSYTVKTSGSHYEHFSVPFYKKST